MNSKYAVQSTDETLESTLIGVFDTEGAAITAAEAAAAVAEAGTEIIVNDPNGNKVWDNEGDWRNAVRN